MSTTGKIIRRIPILPLSALIFYLATLILWSLKLIPSPFEVIVFLESLYQKYGYLGLIFATLLEGIAYLGLYVPGSFIIALTVFFSNGSWGSFLTISILVAICLTITSFINYWLGRYVSSKDFFEKKEFVKESKMFSKGFFLSILHPNILAFYFFNAGLEKKNSKKIFLVPLLLIPYGLFVAKVLYVFSGNLKQKLENPVFLLFLIFLWLIAAFLFEKKRDSHRQF